MKDSTQPGDEDLLSRMLAGDAEAFEALYDRRQAGVYRYALRMSGSPVMAEDVTQDVFIEFMRDARQFDPARGTVAAYLFGIARHKLLRRLQRERLLVSIDADDSGGGDPGIAGNGSADRDPLEILARRETIDSVRHAVSALPVHYREVVVLCNLHEMSYEEAAGIIGVPVGTVRSRLNRAKTMLADKLRASRRATAAGSEIGSARYEL